MKTWPAALLLCVACSSDPVAAPSPSVSSSATPVAYVMALDVAKLTVVVDEADLVTDDSPAGYRVRNDDPGTRTLPVAPDAVVTVNALRDRSDDVEITLAELADHLAEDRGRQALFQLTVSAGVITEIREQYLP